jgi:hypothetical protein
MVQLSYRETPRAGKIVGKKSMDARKTQAMIEEE